MIERAPLQLVAPGRAPGVDLAADGHMDGITSGNWTGSVADDGLAGATFEGTRQ